MKPTYDPELQAEIRKRMSPPSRESVAEIARSTGVNVHTLYSWRHWAYPDFVDRSIGDMP